MFDEPLAAQARGPSPPGLDSTTLPMRRKSPLSGKAAAAHSHLLSARMAVSVVGPQRKQPANASTLAIDQLIAPAGGDQSSAQLRRSASSLPLIHNHATTLISTTTTQTVSRPPELFIAPLSVAGTPIAGRFRFEVSLCHQLYLAGFMEIEVARHIELILSSTRAGAMHANLKSAFEWYAARLAPGKSDMAEMARRLRMFASYNIYLCKLLQWNDMWIETSATLSGDKITRSFKYNSSGTLPPFPLV